MPVLPTLTVSQAHYDRIVAAFPGVDLPAKGLAYNAWLTNNLIDFVEQVEMVALSDRFVLERVAAMAALAASLPPRVPFPSIAP